MFSQKYPAIQQGAVKAAAVGGIAILLLATLTLGLRSLVFTRAAFGMDFYTVYTAGRLAILERGNPYSDVVGQTVHLALHNRLPYPGEDRLNFAYPAHSLLLALPALWMDLDWALAYWLAFNITLLLILPWLALQGKRRWLCLTLPFIPAFVSGLILGNNAVGVGIAFLAGWGLLTRDEKPGSFLQICAGVCLAWGTIKPQLIWAPLLFALLIAAQKRLWGILGGFGAACLGFLGLSWWITPGWPAMWLKRIAEYRAYAGSPPLAFIYPANFLPEPAARSVGIAILAMGGLITAMLFLAWRRGKAPTLPTLAWCSFYTYLVDPAIIITYQEIALVIPILLWVLQPEISNRQALAVWGITFIAAWALFSGSLLKLDPAMFYQLPLVAYGGFLAWSWLASQRQAARKVGLQPALEEG